MPRDTPEPTHYAYDSPDPERLCQGDVLERTPKLVELLNQYHAYYAKQESYEYFLVLTQSCDLVRRDGKPPKAHYITIAAVRPVEEALQREARAHQEWWQIPQHVLSEKSFDTLALFTCGLLDNNQPNYFYLHADVSVGLSSNYCAFLNLSIPLRVEHYDLCLNAKRVQLREPFQAKLGWLVGNLYSRVGTKEWNSHYGDNACSRFASELLQGTFRRVSRKKLAQAEQKLSEVKPLKSYSPDEIFERVQKERVVASTTKLAKNVAAVIKDFGLPTRVASVVVSEMKSGNKLRRLIDEKLENEHDNASQIAVALERAIQELVTGICGEGLESWERLANKLTQQIVQDETIKLLLA